MLKHGAPKCLVLGLVMHADAYKVQTWSAKRVHKTVQARLGSMALTGLAVARKPLDCGFSIGSLDSEMLLQVWDQRQPRFLPLPSILLLVGHLLLKHPAIRVAVHFANHSWWVVSNT